MSERERGGRETETVGERDIDQTQTREQFKCSLTSVETCLTTRPCQSADRLNYKVSLYTRMKH